MPTLQSFLALEKSLAKRLKKRWHSAYRKLAPEVVKAVNRGGMNEAYRLVDSISTEELTKGLTPYISYIGMQALLFGASRISPVKNTGFMEKGAPPVLDNAVAQFEQMVKDLDTALKKQGHKAIDQMVQLQLSSLAEEQEASIQKEDLVREYKDIFDNMVKATGDGLIDVTASLHTSRLSSYGYCVEAELNGIEKYQINEMLDSRTCPVCREMHGKVFDVADTYLRLEQVLQVTDPKQLKAQAPWPKQTKDAVGSLKRMTNSQLVSAGWAYPPFHPLCRGVLDKVGAVVGADVSEGYKNAVSFVHEKGKDYLEEAIEFGAIVNPDTGVVLHKQFGQEASVPITKDMVDLLSGNLFVHNHPSLRSLSDGDLRMASKYGVSRIVAVAVDGTEFSASLLKDGEHAVLTRQELRPKLRDLLALYVERGDITREEAGVLLSHYLNVLLNDLGFITYRTPVVGVKVEKILKKKTISKKLKALVSELESNYGR